MLGADEIRTGTAAAWVGLVMFGGLAPLMVRDARKFWRGPHKVWDGSPTAWDPGGPAYWHGFTRTVPLTAALISLCFVPICLGSVIAPSADSLTFLIPAIFGAAWGFVLVPLMAWVFFFNRPKRLVPPHRRNEPGAIAEFFENRRARREKAASS